MQNSSFRRGSNKDVPPRILSRRPFLTASLLGAGTVVLSACTTKNQADDSNSSSSSSESTSSESASPSQTTAPAFSGSVEIFPVADALEFNPAKTVTLKAHGAKLSDVQVFSPVENGEPIKATGEFNPEKTAWNSTKPLEFNTLYTVKWTAEDPQGGKGSGESKFSTVTPAKQADATLNIEEGMTYGVGEIIEINFSEPVTNKAEVEKAIIVTGGGDQRGKFRWYSDYTARYRPENYWKAKSAIKVQLNLLGVEFGNGMIGDKNITRNFKTSDKRYALVDNNTKMAKLYVNDKLVHENPVTLGNPEWPSVVGKLVVLEQDEKYFFDPGSLDLEEDDPHYYEPFWATNVSRLTESGVFVHQALPSAYSSIGVVNVSHGCIGMLPEDAKYFFDLFAPGDIVETKNTNYPQADPDDGFGDWNIPFERYQDSSWKGNW